jgi:hypothetical protein
MKKVREGEREAKRQRERKTAIEREGKKQEGRNR